MLAPGFEPSNLDVSPAKGWCRVPFSPPEQPGAAMRAAELLGGRPWPDCRTRPCGTSVVRRSCSGQEEPRTGRPIPATRTFLDPGEQVRGKQFHRGSGHQSAYVVELLLGPGPLVAVEMRRQASACPTRDPLPGTLRVRGRIRPAVDARRPRVPLCPGRILVSGSRDSS